MRAVLAMLHERGSVEVEELVETLNVSPATARRDLDALASDRMLARTRGGAKALTVAYDLPLRYRDSDSHGSAKQLIAAAASELVSPGDAIGLSGGTTTTAIANVIATRPDIMAPSPTPNLTIATNAVNIAADLATRPQVKLMVTGGVLHPRSYELVGPFAEDSLMKISLTTAFIGANGFTPSHGASTPHEPEAVVNSLMAQRAGRAVLVIDSSKLGKRAFAAMGGPELFGTIITDGGLAADDRARVIDAGYELIVAE